MFKPASGVAEVIFLATWLAGIVFLVSGLLVTRLKWRKDVSPYGRHSRTLDVFSHPGKYALLEALLLIRILNAIGASLLAVGLIALLYEVMAGLLPRIRG